MFGSNKSGISLDDARKNSAAKCFEEKEGLSESIKANVLPTIMLVRTFSGRIGMAFFRHSEWLVSNAHVIRNFDEIDEGIELHDSQGNIILLQPEQNGSYHRPHNNSSAPDVVVCNTKVTPSRRSIRTLSSAILSSDQVHEEKLYFFIDRDFCVQYLSYHGKEGGANVFKTNNDHPVKPGCSGTPVFSAEVIIGRQPTWRFNIMGAVFARMISHPGMVYIVDIETEFEQILDIINPKEFSASSAQMSIACSKIRDPEQARTHANESSLQSTNAYKQLKKFEKGHSVLVLDLPEGLEKLLGSGILSLNHSALIVDNKNITKDNIRQSCNDFINSQISGKLLQMQSIDIYLKDKYWRIDIKVVHNNKQQYWQIQLQDNTGKGRKINGKSVSSVFAEVKIPYEIACVCGTQLALAIQASMDAANRREQLNSEIKTCNRSQRAVKKNELDTLSTTIIAGISSGFENLQAFKAAGAFAQGPQTPRTDHLFSLVGDDSADDQKLEQHIKELQQDVKDRINWFDETTGDSPIMTLLRAEDLAFNYTKQSKVSVLIKYGAKWNAANGVGESASSLLDAHPNKDSLSYLRK